MLVAATTSSALVSQPTRRPGVSAVDQLECEGIMSASVRDHAKIKARKELLAAHPERQLKVDTSALKGIERFAEFLCHSECSIARGEAIRGSDIDMGLIVSKTPISQSQQAAMVRELRAQGFVAYHASELSPAEPAYPEELLQVIEFKTHDELQTLYQTRGVLPREVQSYVAGYRIDSDSDRPSYRNHSDSFGPSADFFGRSRRGRTSPDFDGGFGFDGRGAFSGFSGFGSDF